MRYWGPQFVALFVMMATIVALGTNTINSTIGLLLFGSAVGFDVGFTFAHEFGAIDSRHHLKRGKA